MECLLAILNHCFRCRKAIAEGELRIGIEAPEDDHRGSQLGWYHPSCLWKTFSFQKNANKKRLDLYNLGCPPAQNSSDHQIYYIFSRESQAKPSFVTGILGGGTTQCATHTQKTAWEKWKLMDESWFVWEMEAKNGDGKGLSI